MASAATAYRNSNSSASGKWPRDLTPWFESCDLPDHLRTTILVMLRRDRHGSQLWMCLTRLAVELGVCRRTVQRRIRRLEEFKVIRRIFEANTRPFPERPDYFRPSATYEAHPEAVKIRPTWKDFEGMRATHRRFRVKSATQHWRCHKIPHLLAHSSPLPAQEASAQTPQPPGAASVRGAPLGHGHRQILGGNRGVRETRSALTNLVTALAKPRQLAKGNVRSQCELPLAHSFIEPKLGVAPDPWADVLHCLRKRINPHTFETWLKPTRFRAAEGKVMFVTIPTREFGHIGEKFAAPIQEAVTESCLGYEQIVFEWNEPVMQEEPALTFDAAVREACRRLAIPIASANEITGWKVKPEGEE